MNQNFKTSQMDELWGTNAIKIPFSGAGFEEVKENIETEPLAKIDYVEAVDFSDISIKDEISDNTLVAMAVYIGKTRLIDNFIVEKI